MRLVLYTYQHRYWRQYTSKAAPKVIRIGKQWFKPVDQVADAVIYREAQ